MVMEEPRVMVISIFFILVLLAPISSGQLLSSERHILFRIQQLLEYPPALQGWANWTNFCDLAPSPTLTVTCSGNHITELTVVGNKTASSVTPKPTQETFTISQETLSEGFSIDTFFTTLTKLSGLKTLSLVSLGMWGLLPEKINRFGSLQVLNVSSNFIYGEIPTRITTLGNLKSLVLADNLFKGNVPDLSAIVGLEEVNVGGNFLGPKFPTLGNKVGNLIMKNNAFRSEIPLSLGKFRLLQHLDLSHNNIIGSIPPTLFSLPSIKYLDLAGNHLMGAFLANASCGGGLKFVDLSDNLLSGDLPRCLRYNSSIRTVVYTWNCLSTGNLKYQHPNSFCHEKAFAVKPPNPMQDQKKHSSSKVGLIVGIIGAILGGILVIGLLVLVILWKGRARETKYITSKNPCPGKTYNGLSPKLVTDARNVSSAMIFGALGLPQYHVFSSEEIEEVTNGFCSKSLIGQGSQGQLYKVFLTDGSTAVVKCLKLKQRYSAQTIGKHIEVLPKLRHQHLVSVLGHSLDTHQDHPNATNVFFLVFEYVSNGTLWDHLDDPRKRDTLKWPQRMAVAIGVARGIQFLHSGVTPGLFGNNLKSKNILLDENLRAKISNYNLPLLYMVGSDSTYSGEETTNHQNSPEDGARQDVYQLGTILLEVITGKHISSQSLLDVQRIKLERGLSDTPSELEELVDPSIRGTFAYESLRNTVEVAINCLSKNAGQRPSIEDVLWNLQYSVQVQEGWAPSGESFGAQS